MTDLHAYLTDLRGLVDGLPHDSGCNAVHCTECGRDWAWCDETQQSGAPRHEFEPGNCNCNHGRALAMIDEVLK
jgi:hypothetical protein